VDLYQGDLLEGWYQDWLLCERERLQNMFSRAGARANCWTRYAPISLLCRRFLIR